MRVVFRSSEKQLFLINFIMKVAVWDTYVPLKNGKIMHFDIIAPQEIRDENVIFRFGKEYLKSKNISELELSSKECSFCHIEELKPEWESEINSKGYYIYEMENCH